MTLRPPLERRAAGRGVDGKKKLQVDRKKNGQREREGSRKDDQ